MKFFLSLAICGIICLNILRSQEVQNDTINQNSESKNTFMFEFNPKLTYFDGGVNTIFGAKAAWLIHGKYFIGIGAYSFAPTPERNFVVEEENDQYEMVKKTITGNITLNYLGICLGYNHNPSSTYHLSTSIFVGSGSMHGDFGGSYWLSANIVEPIIMLERNISNNMKLGISADYRFFFKDWDKNDMGNNESFNSMNYNGFSLGVHFIFGSF